MRTYVDPDLIGGIDITKGPSDGPNSAIGGTINMRTLAAQDLRQGLARAACAARFAGSPWRQQRDTACWCATRHRP
ncbi:hypothetical protein [Hyphomicrobium sp. D-2]|uniref:hypothetical protein n=1 Tax=Hyphomicrobium sp. D-2 TaxID=3041621 RepID=UPI002455C564|nr:hypothetical protein [Hyphomicrobium sp. D-2]MDH4982607.1 hypothetical protein [Hyphomicrobium sp. D-2]